MRMRLLWWLCAVVAFGLVLGCERPSTATMTAEIDEPAYRRGKELLRQGRNQEALAAFLKVIEQRGGDEAPESHLEVGLLYQQQIKDPIAAIYHYRRYTELKPNSPQADLVRQRIAAATREFARTLPAQPLENQVMRNDLLEVVERLQRENVELKDQLAAARLNATLPGATLRPTVADLSGTITPNPPLAQSEPVAEPSPISRAPLEAEEAPRTFQPPTRPGEPNVAVPPGGRRHTVAKGDTLTNLAQRYYNNRSRWRDIYSANRSRMASENDLKIGMELVIPQ